MSQENIEDLDKHIREGITPYFVKTFNEVIAICFP